MKILGNDNEVYELLDINNEPLPVDDRFITHLAIIAFLHRSFGVLAKTPLGDIVLVSLADLRITEASFEEAERRSK